MNLNEYLRGLSNQVLQNNMVVIDQLQVITYDEIASVMLDSFLGRVRVWFWINVRHLYENKRFASFEEIKRTMTDMLFEEISKVSLTVKLKTNRGEMLVPWRVYHALSDGPVGVMCHAPEGYPFTFAEDAEDCSAMACMMRHWLFGIEGVVEEFKVENKITGDLPLFDRTYCDFWPMLGAEDIETMHEIADFVDGAEYLQVVSRTQS